MRRATEGDAPAAVGHRTSDRREGGSALAGRLEAGDPDRPAPQERCARGGASASPPQVRLAARPLVTRLLRWGLGPAVAALCVASVLVGQHLFRPAPHPDVARPAAAPAAARTVAAAAADGMRAATIEARADADAAETAAARATDAVQSAQALLAAATTDLRTVTDMASPQRARQPKSEDPSPLLAVFRETTSRVRELSASAQAAERQAATDADAATRAGSGDPAAAAFTSAASRAARNARTAVGALAQAAGQSSDLSRQAQHAAAAWARIHAEPPGRLGVQVASPPAGAPVHGCEVVSVEPASPATAAGLSGGQGTPAPRGDVITSITDTSDGGAVWKIATCAAFSASMAQTRAGDAVTVAYERRRQPPASGWAPASGSTSLATASGAGCPPPLSGTLTPTPAGSRIRLQVGLSGPAGPGAPLRVTLDPTSTDTLFPDALLRGLGYRAYNMANGTAAVSGNADVTYLYHVPGTAFTVTDGGTAAALATGTLTVIGIPGGSTVELGRGVLQHGTRLRTAGDRWTLTPPCS